MKKTYIAPQMKVATLDCEHLIASSVIKDVTFDPSQQGGGQYTDRYKSPWSSSNWTNTEEF